LPGNLQFTGNTQDMDFLSLERAAVPRPRKEDYAENSIVATAERIDLWESVDACCDAGY